MYPLLSHTQAVAVFHVAEQRRAADARPDERHDYGED